MSMSKEEYKEFLELKNETRIQIGELRRQVWDLEDELRKHIYRTDETAPSNCIGIVD